MSGKFQTPFPGSEAGSFLTDFFLRHTAMRTKEEAEHRKATERKPGCASEEKRRWAVDLFEHGYGYTKAAAILELAPYTVRDWARAWRAGRFTVEIPANQKQHPKYIRLRVLTLRAKGLSWRKIEEKTGVNMSTCRKWVAKHSNDAEEKKDS